MLWRSMRGELREVMVLAVTTDGVQHVRWSPGFDNGRADDHLEIAHMATRLHAYYTERKR